MSTTIYDASQITQRRMNKAQSGSFITRIQSAYPTTGYAPRLGIYDQSAIASVQSGQMKYYRKGMGGCTTISNGCPCAPLSTSCCGTN
jgi:hypothetical protein